MLTGCWFRFKSCMKITCQRIIYFLAWVYLSKVSEWPEHTFTCTFEFPTQLKFCSLFAWTVEPANLLVKWIQTCDHCCFSILLLCIAWFFINNRSLIMTCIFMSQANFDVVKWLCVDGSDICYLSLILLLPLLAFMFNICFIQDFQFLVVHESAKKVRFDGIHFCTKVLYFEYRYAIRQTDLKNRTTHCSTIK